MKGRVPFVTFSNGEHLPAPRFLPEELYVNGMKTLPEAIEEIQETCMC